jgi:hypothetical protein
MKYLALKELPQGQQPGDTFEATEEMGNVLVSIGAAEKVAEPDEPKEPTVTRRRTYQRRDLEPEA